jgi:hypothetical protein
MKILRSDLNQYISINKEQNFKTDVGSDENLKQFEEETLEKIINPLENYETVRHLHKPYNIQYGGFIMEQTDIWYNFYFLSGNTYVPDYAPTDFTFKENSEIKSSFKNSFFRLEFFKTPNNELPNRINRRLVFAKNLSTALGEKYFFESINMLIHKPIFNGSNYRNKENMYLFWFQDESVFNETTLTGDTFWVSAKFFNAKDGSIIDFTNKNLTTGTTPLLNGRVGITNNPIVFYQKGINGDEVIEESDMYYRMVINKNDYTYQIYRGVD